MVVTNHALASGAGTQVLLAGGNAIDAAVAALFALTVVEPMMVGVLGGGVSHIRMADGRHAVIDNLSTAPGRSDQAMFECLSDEVGKQRDVRGRENLIGAKAVAVPGALAGWCEALEKFGSLSLSDVMQPAIALAERGFRATPYLHNCIADTAADLKTDPGLSKLFLPSGSPITPGSILAQPEYAETLRLIARHGSSALYDGPLGAALSSYMATHGGLIDKDDLAGYRVVAREPIAGSYRGYSVFGPPPPSASGVHIVQMLNILESYDIGALGFGSADGVHLLAEALKIAFADRAVATADPAFVSVPVKKLTDKRYADDRRALIEMHKANVWSPGVGGGESNDTTHVTVADEHGNVITSTQTINGVFGACVQIPGTGMLANNYMFNFDPHPNRALSIAPGKRVFTSMAPMIVMKDDRLAFALGLPGALRIFPSALQAIVNLIDHGMTLQEAVEAPRIWTEGGNLEVEAGFLGDLEGELCRRGHKVVHSPRIAGGMNAIAFGDDGMLTGAACWRADGTPIAISGGLARDGSRFNI